MTGVEGEEVEYTGDMVCPFVGEEGCKEVLKRNPRIQAMGAEPWRKSRKGGYSVWLSPY
jgi:hypothetical protein